MEESSRKMNEYALLQFKRDYSGGNEEGTQRFQKVVFYEMHEDGTFENGTTLEEMLRVTFERLTDLNNRFPCSENEGALTYIEKAQILLEERRLRQLFY